MRPNTFLGAETWLSEEDCDLEGFRALVEQSTDLRQYPAARAVEQNVLIYDADHLRDLAATGQKGRDVKAEIARALSEGPGVLVIERAFDVAVVDEVTLVLRALIEAERAKGTSRGDHFAKAGANERLWDALGKLALAAPEAFVEYYANDIIALVSTAWLGPGYQITSQVNVVNPGGAAQTVHRDYHLGFVSNERAAAYPAHVHRLSPLLTLQGAVAHSEMPVESGPTLYVPHSQKYLPGYLAWRLPPFRQYAEEHNAQLPLARGDAVFLSPALFHAAGHNRTAEVRRMANLLQISSAFGRAMESVDREALTNAVFPALLHRKAKGAPEQWLRNIVAACAEGYSFPTNLDLDVPMDGLAPPAPADIMWRALDEEWSPEVLRHELQAARERRRAQGEVPRAQGEVPRAQGEVPRAQGEAPRP